MSDLAGLCACNLCTRPAAYLVTLASPPDCVVQAWPMCADDTAEFRAYGDGSYVLAVRSLP